MSWLFWSNRERLMNLLQYKSVDRLPAVHFGYWSELLQEWAEQGKISKELADSQADSNDADRELDRILGWDFNYQHVHCGNHGLFPAFDPKVLETLPDGSQRVQNSVGLIERVVPGIASIPAAGGHVSAAGGSFYSGCCPVCRNDSCFTERPGGGICCSPRS